MKDKLMALAKGWTEAQERFYVQTGPHKHEQENFCLAGICTVGMNVTILEHWLQCCGEDVIEFYESLPTTEQREIWEASNFKFGTMNFTQEDVDDYWKIRGRKCK